MITKAERDIAIIHRILKYCGDVDKAIEHFGKSFDIFKNVDIFRNAVGMAIMQIGELSNHLSEEFRISHSDVPWKQIRGMRNMFAHDYYGIDIEAIWRTAVDDIPVLRKFCEGVFDEQKTSE